MFFINLRSLEIISSNIFFCVILSLLSRIPFKHMVACSVMSSGLRSVHFSSFLSIYSSDWIILINLSSRLLILSSVCLNLVLSTCSKFLISVIVFLNSRIFIWFLKNIFFSILIDILDLVRHSHTLVFWAWFLLVSLI